MFVITKPFLYVTNRLLDPAFRSVPNFSSLLPQLTSQPAQHDGSPYAHSEARDSETASIILTQEDEQSVQSSVAPEEEEGQAVTETNKSILDVPSIDVRKSRFSVGCYPANKQPDGNVTAGNEAKAVVAITESDDTVRHTQSLPQLPPVSDGPSLTPQIASKEFDMLMKEVCHTKAST